MRDECRTQGRSILGRLAVKRDTLFSIGDEQHRGSGLRAIKIHLDSKELSQQATFREAPNHGHGPGSFPAGTIY